MANCGQHIFNYIQRTSPVTSICSAPMLMQSSGFLTRDALHALSFGHRDAQCIGCFVFERAEAQRTVDVCNDLIAARRIVDTVIFVLHRTLLLSHCAHCLCGGIPSASVNA